MANGEGLEMDSLQDWLVGEPGAVWITGTLLFVLTLIGLIVSSVRRERAPRVVIQEIESIRLLDIHPSQRDRLRVFFVDEKGIEEPVEDLRQREIVIYNDGTRDILEPLELRLQFLTPGSRHRAFAGLWWWFFDDTRYSATEMHEEETTELGSTKIHTGLARGARLELPYLNSYRVHGDYVEAHLISDGEFDITVWGKVAGKGWSAHFTPLHRVIELQHRVQNRLVVGMGVLGIIGFIVASFGVVAQPELSLPIPLVLAGMTLVLLAIVLTFVGLTVSGRIVHTYLHVRAISEFR